MEQITGERCEAGFFPVLQSLHARHGAAAFYPNVFSYSLNLCFNLKKKSPSV